jgi:hypothetical protein
LFYVNQSFIKDKNWEKTREKLGNLLGKTIYFVGNDILLQFFLC